MASFKLGFGALLFAPKRRFIVWVDARMLLQKCNPEARQVDIKRAGVVKVQSDKARCVAQLPGSWQLT